MDDAIADDYELRTLNSTPRDNTGPGLQSLPRADGGRQAWLFLTACFILEALVWGA